MKMVSQEDFYKKIGPLDVVLKVVGSFPYTTEFNMRYGGLVGKAVSALGKKKGEPSIVSSYYIIEE